MRLFLFVSLSILVYSKSLNRYLQIFSSCQEILTHDTQPGSTHARWSDSWFISTFIQTQPLGNTKHYDWGTKYLKLKSKVTRKFHWSFVTLSCLNASCGWSSVANVYKIGPEFKIGGRCLSKTNHKKQRV